MAISLPALMPPYIDLDFTRFGVDSRVTFTRSTTRTYCSGLRALATAAINEWPLEYDFDTGALLGRGVFVLSSNQCLCSDGLTNAVWVKTNGTAAKDQTDLFGTANGASSFTATGANATVLQTITSTSTLRLYSVYLKRLSGTGAVLITLDGGTTWTAVTLTSNYKRFLVTQTLANPTIGVKLATSGDSVAIAGNQLEGDPGGGFASPYIPTAGSVVSRAADVASITTANLRFDSTKGGAMLSYVLPYSARSGTFGALVFASNNASVYFTNNTVPRVFDGATSLKSGVVATAGAVTRVASSYGPSGLKIRTSGGSLQTGSFDGAMSGDGSPARIGRYNFSTSAQQINGWLRKVKFFSRELSTDEIAGWAV